MANYPARAIVRVLFICCDACQGSHSLPEVTVRDLLDEAIYDLGWHVGKNHAICKTCWEAGFRPKKKREMQR